MEFRPCIDIHNGTVKQIVGGSLLPADHGVVENFVAEQDAAFYARYYQSMGLTGGHVILLNPPESEYFPLTQKQALAALAAYPDGLQVGGGITAENAAAYLHAGASHVIVTSYVFQGGQIHYDNLKKLVKAVGRRHLVLDLSCRKKAAGYYIVTDRWQNYTETMLTEAVLAEFSAYCDEFLLHAVDVEGKAAGIDEELAGILGKYDGNPVTYAGGVHSLADLAKLKALGQGRIHVTVGSALDLFGGNLKLTEILSYLKET